ncbi:MAG: methyltransferase domain-containing protein [Candidatus Omnitrophota bacterium]
MKKDLLDMLICLKCRKSAFELKVLEKDDIEIRRGNLLCSSCNTLYAIDNGILDFLKDTTIDVERERDAVNREEYFLDDEGNKYKIDKSSINKFEKQFMLLPEGDGSGFFKKGGCFQPISEGSVRFYDTLDRMELKGGESILCLGDGFGYASYKFSKKNSRVIALDISKYLLASDIYIKNSYFDRIFSDMHGLPFKEGSFDIVFCSAVLHHSKDLKKVFSEICRVLKNNGRLFVINECARGVFERRNPLFDDLEKRGYGDTAYTIPEWLKACKVSGFQKVKIEFLSIVNDYIVRKKSKGINDPGLPRIVLFFKKHPGFEKIFLYLLTYPRILLRPKSWRMTCSK